MAKEAGPSGGGPGNFKNFANTQAEEDAFNFVKWRNVPKPNGILGSVAHMVKGALGAGILGGHVAYKKAGYMVGLPMNLVFGMYIAYCLYLLVECAQILNKRTRVATLTYPDVGEAAVACFPNPKIARFSRKFRYFIDTIICIDLFGSCAVYQIIISKTVKQLVENRLHTEMAGYGGHPHMRVYLISFLIPLILICLIIHLKWLAPFSVVANLIVLFCICLAVHYAFQFNPKFENMVAVTGLYQFLEYVGMSVFSMSCAGVVIPIENNMRNPNQFNIALCLGMSLIIFCTFCTSFFGYVAFLDKSESPITINFPLTLGPKILKGGIAIMIYVTHALNFWVPFNICFYYLALYHKTRLFFWELVYRATFVFIICVIAIVFPDIDALMGVLGTLCLSNMAFIWPNTIYLLVIWERPGLGKYKWRLWKAGVLLGIGCFILVAGTIVNGNQLLEVFRK